MVSASGSLLGRFMLSASGSLLARGWGVEHPQPICQGRCSVLPTGRRLPDQGGGRDRGPVEVAVFPPGDNQATTNLRDSRCVALQQHPLRAEHGVLLEHLASSTSY
jgi:hypothetical protein